MLRKIIFSGLFVIALFGISLQTAYAKKQTDWSKVVSATDNEIAVKTSNGKTVFGKLTSANDSEIVIQIASKQELTSQSMTIQKSEVKKVWFAKLRFGKNPALATGIGAAIGAGVGFGLGYGLLAATGGSDSGREILAGTAAIGAGVGAALGYLVGRQSHQKQIVIYEI
jgi:hypothetical protein